MTSINEKTSADIEREIEADRQRIGSRLDAIQERMSPGQLVDEALAYAKDSGGAEFASNLGQSLKNNPLPVALMGVSLAWLMAKGNSSSTPHVSSTASTSTDVTVRDDYPLYPVNGPVRRLGPPEPSGDVYYSHFGDSSGKRVKALSDKTGRRAGHFVDEAGKTYRGFMDASGQQISNISDETGRMFDEASGWISKTWNQIMDSASHVGHRASSAAGSLSSRSATTGANMQDQMGRLNDAILTHFRDQPLVGGALAFAVGAAIGAALPNTDTENQMLGETADAAKDAVRQQATGVYHQGKDIAADAGAKAASVASDVYDVAKERITEEMEGFKPNGKSQDNGAARPTN